MDKPSTLDEALDVLRFKLTNLEAAGWGQAPEAEALRIVLTRADRLRWLACHSRHIADA